MKRWLLAAVLAATLSIPSGFASAADDDASCVGLGLSDHAQWGEMPEVIQELKGLLDSFGIHPGAFVSLFAQRHEETHDPGCEEAAEEIITGLLD